MFPSRGILTLIFTAIACANIASARPTLPSDEQQPAVESAAPLSVKNLAKSVGDSLVIVRATGRNGREFGFGAGFVISPDGLVATARHVIGDGRPIRIEFPDGTSVPVTHVHASSEKLDLVVLKIEKSGLAALELGIEAEAVQGHRVVAMGHPQGLNSSIVDGIVSGRRDIDGVSMLQLAMSIEQGNSGGPVVDYQGRVLGVVTMKSTASDNIGFAVPVNHLRQMLDSPNSIPISNWITISALDENQWQVLWDANWRQRAGRLEVDGSSTAFGDRSLCLSAQDPPEIPFEIQVSVKLDDERGAAGLAFHADGGDRHYGFYPSAGNLRLTRFDGPDLSGWTILHNEPHSAYLREKWNVLKVRVEKDRFLCFVNDVLVHESMDDVIPPGRIGLATFRRTSASFRRFRADKELPGSTPTAEQVENMRRIADTIRWLRPAEPSHIKDLTPYSRFTSRFLNDEAERLERRAEQVRKLAREIHFADVRGLLRRELHPAQDPAPAAKDSPQNPPAARVNLLKAALLVARLDNEDVDVEFYMQRVDQLAAEIRRSLPQNPSEQQRLEAIDRFLFQENGFRGSRHEYYSHSNSYLNEVIDDREGLPITLSVLYMEIARRLDLNVVGLGLPGHFVVRYEPADPNQEKQVIDVFNRGKRMSDDEVAAVIRNSGYRQIEPFIAAQSSPAIIQRMIVNLLNLAENRRDDEQVLKYLETLFVITDADPVYRAKRLELRARTGRLAEAIEDADWFVANLPEGTNSEQLYELRAQLVRQLELQNQQR